MRTVCENDREIIENPLPDLLKTKYETESDIRHRSWYAKGLAHWSGFEGDVQKKMKQMPWDKDNILSTRPKNPTENPAYTDNEQNFCGDEQSVVGRLSDNGLHPVTSVARSWGIPIRYGDFKVCQESKSDAARQSANNEIGEKAVPNLVAVEVGKPDKSGVATKAELRIIGKVKTPWKHNLPKYCKEFEKSAEGSLRRAFGQPAGYMHQYGMKYGFLTTYNHTIFLMQRHDRSGQSCLYYSIPIPHYAKADGGNVSLRQCFLYLTVMVSSGKAEDYRATNTFHFNDWVRQSNPKDDMPSPASPYAGQLKSPSYAHLQRAAHAPMSPSPKGLPNIGSLSINERRSLALNENGTYTATITLAAEQISGLNGDGSPYITVNGKAIYLELDKQRRPVGTQHPSDFGSSKLGASSFKSTQGGFMRPEQTDRVMCYVEMQRDYPWVVLGRAECPREIHHRHTKGKGKLLKTKECSKSLRMIKGKPPKEPAQHSTVKPKASRMNLARRTGTTVGSHQNLEVDFSGVQRNRANRRIQPGYVKADNPSKPS